MGLTWRSGSGGRSFGSSRLESEEIGEKKLPDLRTSVEVLPFVCVIHFFSPNTVHLR